MKSYLPAWVSPLTPCHMFVMSSGGGYTGGHQHHRTSDIATAAPCLALHPVLRVQTLPCQDVQEEEEKR